MHSQQDFDPELLKIAREALFGRDIFFRDKAELGRKLCSAAKWLTVNKHSVNKHSEDLELTKVLHNLELATKVLSGLEDNDLCAMDFKCAAARYIDNRSGFVQKRLFFAFAGIAEKGSSFQLKPIGNTLGAEDFIAVLQLASDPSAVFLFSEPFLQQLAEYAQSIQRLRDSQGSAFNTEEANLSLHQVIAKLDSPLSTNSLNPNEHFDDFTAGIKPMPSNPDPFAGFGWI